LASISPADLARELLDDCLAGSDWRAASLEKLVAMACDGDTGRALEASRALFGILIERLGDLFEPRLCEVYARLFSQVMRQVRPELRAEELVARYRRVRQPPPPPENVRRAYVLSRVTLGADVAVTSVLLDAMKRRYPDAEICFVGSRKGWELFAADSRIRHTQAPYARTGTLAERLAAGFALRDALAGEDAIIVDPDSRLTQLGLLPVCDEERYFFFESRSFGGDGEEAMSALAARWAEQTFAVSGARSYVAPEAGELRADITVSLGVGENPAKRIGDPFETELLRMLAATGRTVLVDKGGSEEEAARVKRAVAACGGQVQTWQGAFAPFAAAIAGSRLYAGYDSAGQHVAAASGVPLLTIFAGFPSERMFQRWRPYGRGPIRVVRAGDPEPERVVEAARAALADLHLP
jgi:ADP-heptose:LPS heptosyltransferase